MKITVGKVYEGASDIRIEDGTYDLQIIKIASTKGRVNMTFSTSDKRFVYKTFFLIDKDGKQSTKGMRELADFVTTAMQIEDEEVEVDVNSALGYYITAYVKNGSYIGNTDGLKHTTVYVNRPQRCDGFSDGTPSLLDELGKRNKRNSENEKPVIPAEDEAELDEDADDIFNKFM